MSGYYIIFNGRSGTASAQGITVQSLEQRFRDAGLAVIIDDDRQLPTQERLQRASRSSADVVVAAGGDGTVTAVANAIIGTGKSMAILPLGTVNLLARDLKIPLDFDAWIAALPGMEPRRIDVGEVNGQIFLHKVVAGVIPGVAAAREHIRQETKLSAKIGFVLFFFRRLVRARPMIVDIIEPGRSPRTFRIAAVAVANNQYDEGPGLFFSRQRLDRGHLTVYLLKRLGVGDVFRLATKMVLGKWRHDEALQIEATPTLTLRARRARLHVMLDGEVEKLAIPLQFRIRPLALSVMAPPVTQLAEEEPEAGLPANGTPSPSRVLG